MDVLTNVNMDVNVALVCGYGPVQADYIRSHGAKDVIVCPDETAVSSFHKSDIVRKLGGIDMCFEGVGAPTFMPSLRCVTHPPASCVLMPHAVVSRPWVAAIGLAHLKLYET